MATTQQVFGTIGAISTFIENFPNSLLDLFKGKVYTSIFDFIIDLLTACGVSVDDIIAALLREIYGLEAVIDGSIDNLYRKILNGQVSIENQNAFMMTLEYSIKVILMSLFTSLFTCSSIPVLPNRVFDGPNSDSFANGPFGPETLLLQYLQNNGFKPFVIPVALIDPFNILSISPTSPDGQLYYMTEEGDVYYRKTETVVYEGGEPIYTNQVPLYLIKTLEGDLYTESCYVLSLQTPVSEDIRVTIKYKTCWGDSESTWESTITAGALTTNDWIISPYEMVSPFRVAEVYDISINNNGSGAIAGADTWVYLDRALSSDVIEEWNGYGATSLDTNVIWGGPNDSSNDGNEVVVLAYERCERKETKKNNPERVSSVPTEVTDISPDYIVCYEGLNPNTLYKTMDMNTFIWYCLRKGMKTPQVEYNHMMWDSRVSAARKGVMRSSAVDWNTWYSSKSTYTDEFTDHGGYIINDSPLYPVIQLESQGMAENLLRVHIPAQRYFRPQLRESNLGVSDKKLITAFNASVYKFTWEYLINIQILHPRLLLVGLCEYLLGFSFSTVRTALNSNITKKIIEAKLSSAIKNVIEANDMEVEDCYTEFSNDEVNEMLEEMLLSRYSATTYNGESSPIRTHDIDSYLSALNEATNGASTTQAGNITQINRLVTEVMADPGTEASINYGLQTSIDSTLLEKLLWGLTMPIVQSLFTPQVMLIMAINFELLGITRIDQFLSADFGIILNFLMNKIMGLIKSIVLYIKDKIVEILIAFFNTTILPFLIKYKTLLFLERLNYWLEILASALASIPRFKIEREKIVANIDEVNYADIVNDQTEPEATSSC